MEKQGQGKVGKRGSVLFYDSYLSYTIQRNEFDLAKKTLEKKIPPGKNSRIMMDSTYCTTFPSIIGFLFM